MVTGYFSGTGFQVILRNGLTYHIVFPPTSTASKGQLHNPTPLPEQAFDISAFHKADHS